MENNDIINIEKIPESAKKESSYKNFPIPEIIYKPKNKILLLPRIKNINNNNNNNNKDFDTNNNSKRNNNSNSNSNSVSKRDKCFSEKKRLKSGKSKKSVHNVILNSKKCQNFHSIPNKNKIVKLGKVKSRLKNGKNVEINISESINNCKRHHLKKYLPKITITSDKLYHNFRDGVSKLKQKPLEEIIRKRNEKQNNKNSTQNRESRENDIFKTTEVIQHIKVGCKYDPEDNNTIEDDGKNEFNEKLKNYMNGLSNIKKNKSRNLRTKNCYEILEDLKRKKTYDCEKLIVQTTNQARRKKREIFLIYNNLRKSIEQNDDWNINDYYD
jgi:hypothetical protein